MFDRIRDGLVANLSKKNPKSNLVLNEEKAQLEAKLKNRIQMLQQSADDNVEEDDKMFNVHKEAREEIKKSSNNPFSRLLDMGKEKKESRGGGLLDKMKERRANRRSVYVHEKEVSSSSMSSSSSRSSSTQKDSSRVDLLSQDNISLPEPEPKPKLTTSQERGYEHELPLEIEFMREFIPKNDDEFVLEYMRYPEMFSKNRSKEPSQQTTRRMQEFQMEPVSALVKSEDFSQEIENEVNMETQREVAEQLESIKNLEKKNYQKKRRDRDRKASKIDRYNNKDKLSKKEQIEQLKKMEALTSQRHNIPKRHDDILDELAGKVSHRNTSKKKQTRRKEEPLAGKLAKALSPNVTNFENYLEEQPTHKKKALLRLAEESIKPSSLENESGPFVPQLPMEDMDTARNRHYRVQRFFKNQYNYLADRCRGGPVKHSKKASKQVKAMKHLFSVPIQDD